MHPYICDLINWFCVTKLFYRHPDGSAKKNILLFFNHLTLKINIFLFKLKSLCPKIQTFKSIIKSYIIYTYDLLHQTYWLAIDNFSCLPLIWLTDKTDNKHLLFLVLQCILFWNFIYKLTILICCLLISFFFVNKLFLWIDKILKMSELVH